MIEGSGFGGEPQRTPAEGTVVSDGSKADFDPLTGLLNQRGLEPILEREWNLARRRAVPSILVVADIDRFKRLNEDGWEIGDRALRKVGRILAACCRATDVVARVGGDDFVVVLVGAKGEQPTSYVERVTARVAADDRAPALSISYGWSKLIHATDPQHAIDLADALMHKRRAVSGTRAV